MAAEGHIEGVTNNTYKENYHNCHLDELAALCNILGLSRDGVKDDDVA